MKLSDVMNRAKQALSEVADDLDTAITAVKEKHGNEISEVADTMIKGAADLVGEAIGAVEEAVSELKDDIRKDEELEEAAENVVDAVANETEAEVETVVDAVEAVADEEAEAEMAPVKEAVEEATQSAETVAEEAEVADENVEAENAEEEITRTIPDGMSKTVNKAQQNLDQIISKLKKLIAEGNVDRIVVKKDGETVLNIPVNVGIVGGLIGLHSAPWIVAITALAAYGFKYQFEIVKKDGSTDEVE